MRKILFLCTANSARSQIAEAWAKKIWSGKAAVASAGIAPSAVNPWVIRTMKQHGIDMSGHYSKGVGEIDLEEYDLVITVCPGADEKCPVLPASVTKYHHPFDDPIEEAKSLQDDEEKAEVFSRTSDEIRSFIENFKLSAY